jgi:hypothetical protein
VVSVPVDDYDVHLDEVHAGAEGGRLCGLLRGEG